MKILSTFSRSTRILGLLSGATMIALILELLILIRPSTDTMHGEAPGGYAEPKMILRKSSPPASYYDVISNTALFGDTMSTERTTVPPTTVTPIQPIVQPTSPIEPPHWTLLGIYKSAATGSALLVDASGKQSRELRIRDELEGWTVREIRTRTVVLERSGNSATLMFPADAPDSPKAAPSLALPGVRHHGVRSNEAASQ